MEASTWSLSLVGFGTRKCAGREGTRGDDGSLLALHSSPRVSGILRSERQTNPLRECEVLVPPGSGGTRKRDPTESKEFGLGGIGGPLVVWPLEMFGRPRFAAGVCWGVATGAFPPRHSPE